MSAILNRKSEMLQEEQLYKNFLCTKFPPKLGEVLPREIAEHLDDFDPEVHTGQQHLLVDLPYYRVHQFVVVKFVHVIENKIDPTKKIITFICKNTLRKKAYFPKMGFIVYENTVRCKPLEGLKVKVIPTLIQGY